MGTNIYGAMTICLGTHIIPLNVLEPHFTDKETEAQKY